MGQQRLENCIDTLKNEGILDGEYEETRKVQIGANLPNFMMDLINSFLHDGDNSMREIPDLLTERNVDFTKVTIAAHLIIGGSKSLGGCQVVPAARVLINASLNQEKRSCETLHKWVVNEFYRFRDELGTLYQMERAIVNKKSSKRGEKLLVFLLVEFTDAKISSVYGKLVDEGIESIFLRPLAVFSCKLNLGRKN